MKRVADPGDGRSMLVEITRKGLSLVDRVAPAHLENEKMLLAGLDHEEQRTLASLLRTLLCPHEADQLAPPPSGRGGRRRSKRQS